MKPDIELQRIILNSFINAESAHITLPLVLKDLNIDISNESFYFNYQLLVENELIGDEHLNSGRLEHAGISHVMSGPVLIGNQKLRLTSDGHDFASALSNKAVFERLKTEFKDAPFKVIFDGSQKLLNHYFKNKLDEFTGE